MKKLSLFIAMFFAPIFSFCQLAPKDQAAFEREVNGMLDFSVTPITTKELAKHKDEFVILDSREKEEYDVSHIEGSRFVGYDNFEFSSLKEISKDAKIAVYCSIGYRSEKIGEKLRKEGYENVYNVFGSIFQWVNEGRPIVNSSGERVSKIHTYNRKWSRWVFNQEVEKVW